MIVPRQIGAVRLPIGSSPKTIFHYKKRGRKGDREGGRGGGCEMGGMERGREEEGREV